MPYVRQLVAEKANIINHNKKVYGAFAEIGAGQEVVNYFFKAGRASNTVAKSISAYDMTFSDLIYGKSKRYVCEKRLIQMLRHEYSLLQKRLKNTKGKTRCFFAFADTVAVSALERKLNHHGWMGLRFQSKPLRKYNDILLHMNFKDQTRLQQYEVLGVLGVNLIYTAFYEKKIPAKMISSLMDHFEKNRVEIDFIKCQGPDFKNISPLSLSLQLLKQNLTQLLVFSPNLQAPIDVFYEKPVFLYSDLRLPLQRFKNKARSHFKKPFLSFYVSKNLNKTHHLPKQTILHNCRHWFEIKNTLRQYTNKEIIVCMSLKELKDFFHEKNYKPSYNLIQALGLFFDKKTKILVTADKKQLEAQGRSGMIKSLIDHQFILPSL